MATLNVQDYGAKGDGSTDDTDAINRCLGDTSQGDTVLFPATNDYYKVIETGSREACEFWRVADGVTITGEVNSAGDGTDSVIKMGDVPVGNGEPNKWVAGIDDDQLSSPLTGVTIKNLRFNGNKAVNANIDGGSVTCFSFYENGSGYDVTFEDVIFEDAGSVGLSLQSSRITLNRITVRNCYRHGIEAYSTGAGSKSNPDIDATSVKAVNNGNGTTGNGTGIDVGGGYHKFQNLYFDSNQQGSKIGSTGGKPEYLLVRNANFSNQVINSGWRETGSVDFDGTIDFDNVQFINAALIGCELSDSGTYNITEMLVDGANQAGKSGGNYEGFEAEVDATVNADTLRIQNTVNGPGLRTLESAVVDINDYYHYQNDGGAIDNNSGNLRIQNQINQQSARLDVPGPDDVGAYSDTTVEEEEPATYQMDFAGYETGTTPPGWTPEYASNNADWSIVAGSDPVGGNQLRFDGVQSDRHALSNDEVGSAKDVELLALFQVGDLSQNVTSGGRLILRGSGTDGSESSYFLNVRDVNFGIWKYVSGGTDKLSEWGTPQDGQWYFARFRASGSQLQARVWPSDADEPDNWDAEVSDNSLSTGWIGVGSYSEFADDWGYLSVGVGGESAPMPAMEPGATGAVLQTLSGSLQSVDSSVQTG